MSKIFMYRDGPDESHYSVTALPCSSLELAKLTADSMAGKFAAENATEWVERHRGCLMRTLTTEWIEFHDPTGLAPDKVNQHRVQFIEEEELDFRPKLEGWVK